MNINTKNPIVKIGLLTATSIVIANMIGTGVFTTLSYQVLSMDSEFSILMLWLVGGVIALCGALTYSELAAAMPKSGGEYFYLSRLYHPSVGFASGWVSMVVGFSAPIAAAAIAMSEYITKIYPSLYPRVIASVVVIALAILHGTDVKAGGMFQNIFTILKILLIVFLIFAGFVAGGTETVNLVPDQGDWDTIFGTSAFATGLVWVYYAYSGWNASAYIAGEVDNPRKNIPKSLLVGTIIVMVLYLLLNFIFLYVVPRAEMVKDFGALNSDPELAIGFLAGKSIFGEYGGKFISALIAFGLVSAISSMTIAGPRVMRAMGEDFKLFRILSVTNKDGAPMVAVAVQTVIAVTLILTSSFADVLNYIGFTLSIFATLTVGGVFILRLKHKTILRPYKTWGYPVTPILFIALNLWMVYYLISEKPVISLYGLGTVGIGLVLYFLVSDSNNNKPEDQPLD